MEKYVIHGGKPLHGEVTISGAKNAAVAIVPAALMVDGPCIIENVPDIVDVKLQFEILKEMGVKVTQLARGVSVGNEIEYTDELTLGRSIINRTLFSDSFQKQ